MIQLTLDELTPPKITLSKYQTDIFDFVKNGTGHGIINAAAGSSKTFTLVKALDYIPKDKKIIFCAFNNHIVEELKTKVPANCLATTIHRLGYRSLMMAGYHPRIDKFKQGTIFDQIIKTEKLKDTDDYYFPVRDTVSLMKGMLLPENAQSIKDITDFHDIDTGNDQRTFEYLVLNSLKIANLRKNVIDFDDMYWLALKHNIYIPQYDYVLIDEVQDLNMAQVELALRACAPGGRIIACGDQNQGIYGFRGACVDAITMTSTRLNATNLPLSISYRCPVSHVKLAQKYVPGIEWAPTAKEGVSKKITGREFTNMVRPGDMCICRNNAPLVDYAFDALAKGYKINIRGQDIGHGLQAIVKRMHAKSIPDLVSKLGTWKDEETKKLLNEKKNPERVEDKHRALISLTGHVKSVNELLAYIKQIFSDENKEIVFSSIHRAKGMESERVFIIKFGLIPSRWAILDWEKIQEKNIAYVGVTRSKNELYFVD